MSILKLWQTKNSDGKSVRFLVIVILGYGCGILHKVFYSYDFVTWLYLLNMLMVALDLALTVRYRKRKT